MEYMINVWNRSNGCSCLLRTIQRSEWIKEIRRLKNEYSLSDKQCRTIVRDKRSVFSFSESKQHVEPWRKAEFYSKPIMIYNGFPKGVE